MTAELDQLCPSPRSLLFRFASCFCLCFRVALVFPWPLDLAGFDSAVLHFGFFLYLAALHPFPQPS
jgi:hypothetical protein